ncbi:MAG: molybdenum cofactor biosynthesis protein MoaE [Thermodesulfovibrio sp.]|nr:molybdenum cofactor biosynthesis protein MoaE [Thermodesulfovibrio sp.]
MIEEWIRDIKKQFSKDLLGMILIHNGVVRATSRDGKVVKGMRLSYSFQKLKEVLEDIRRRPGIVDVRVWINEGELKVGDDIMKVLIAGRLRTDVFPAMEELVGRIKNEVVYEEEIY